MLLEPLTREMLDRLSKDLYNKRVGDFLYIHYEANPVWLVFLDLQRNTVQHGGQGDSTDVIVRITDASRAVLEPRLTAYLSELVGRHHEVLHEEGKRRFHGVTITLPYKSVPLPRPYLEVTIHTGSGACYDQDEIAYEVMAALSGVPTLKALAPADSYYGFVRTDRINDDDWVGYVHQDVGIRIEFSPMIHGNAYVSVSMYKHDSRENREKFKNAMYDLVSEYVKSRTDQVMLRKEGRHVFGITGGEGAVVVEVDSGSSSNFSVTVPYSDHESFARLKYAKRAMEMLHENFKEEVSVA